MNITLADVSIILGVFVAGFVFGSVVTYQFSRMVLSHYRKRIGYLSTACDTWVFSCRRVLADSWFEKVCKLVQHTMQEGEKQ